MKPLLLIVVVLCVAGYTTYAQVDGIKNKSSSHSSGSESSGSGTSGFYADLCLQSIDMFVMWQKITLEKKEVNPTITSFDVMLQAAIQPSSYYIVNPRIRANWGLFSTDFRLNYLIEEDYDGAKFIRTDDWQIIQLNLVTVRNVTFRVGGGTLHEDFSGGKTFPEWTTALHLFPNHDKFGGVTEYRWSEPRLEWSGFMHYQVFKTGHMHTYLTGGVAFQRYYRSINVWGMQGGLMFRFY
jgi:hypothetical protein